MSGWLADAIGLVGSVVFLAAYGYATFGPTIDKLVFNAANLLGAVLLLVSLSVHFNLASFVLEVAWGVIALVGLGETLIRRGRAKR